MDPRRLASERTFRWTSSEESTEGYEAVETRGDSLVWYRWSHVHGGGKRDEVVQSATAFAAHGPARSAPPWVRAELAAWAARITGASAS